MNIKEKSEKFPSMHIDLDAKFLWQIWTIRTTSKGNLTKLLLLYSWILPYAGDKIGWQSTVEDGTNSLSNTNGNTVKILLQRTDYYGIGNNIAQYINKLRNGSYLNEIETGEISAVPKDILNLSLGIDHNQISVNFIIRPEILLPIEHLLIPWNGKAIPSPTNYSVFVSQLFHLQKVKLLSFEEFKLDDEAEKLAIKNLCSQLKNVTGFDMTKESAPRIGNIEWYRMPVSDEDLLPLISFNNLKTNDIVNGIQVLLKPLLSGSKNILIRCRLINGGEITLDEIKESKWSKNDLEINFRSLEPVSKLELTIWEKYKDTSTILFEQSFTLIRTLSTNMSIVGSQINSGRINLLNKLANKEEEKKTELAIYDRSSSAGSSKIGGYKNDPWVSSSRTAKDYMKQLYPDKSQSHFFLNGWDQEKGESGQLSFIEWIFETISGTKPGGIIFIDPYFDNDAIEIFANARTTNTSYHILTCTQHREKDEQTKENQPNSKSQPSDDIERVFTQTAQKIRETCKQRKPLINNLNLYISDLTSADGGKQQLFHDRYLLILDNNGRPEQGFHLSNSLQGATRKAPLLVTSIPEDILPKVYNYVEDLIEPTHNNQNNKKTIIKRIWPIEPTKDTSTSQFDVKSDNTTKYINCLTEIPQSPFFFSLLLSNPSLQSASEVAIYEELTRLGIKEKEDSTFVLHKLTPQNLRDFVYKMSLLEQSDFNRIKAALGEFLARSSHFRDEFQSSDGNIIPSYDALEELIEQIKKHPILEEKLLSFIIGFDNTPHYKTDRVRLCYNIFHNASFEKVVETTLAQLPYFGGDFFGIEYKYFYACKFLIRCFNESAVSLLENLILKADANGWNEGQSDNRAVMLVISTISHHMLQYNGIKCLNYQIFLLKSNDYRIRAAASAALIEGLSNYESESYTFKKFNSLLKENLCDEEYRLTLSAYISEQHISQRNIDNALKIKKSYVALIKDWTGKESLIKRNVVMLGGRLEHNRSYEITLNFLKPLITIGRTSNELCFDYWNDIFLKKITTPISNSSSGASNEHLNFSPNTDYELTNSIVDLYHLITEEKQFEILETWNKTIITAVEIVNKPLTNYIAPTKFHFASHHVYWLTTIVHILIQNDLVTSKVKINCKNLIKELERAYIRSERYITESFSLSSNILNLKEKYQNRHDEGFN